MQFSAAQPWCSEWTSKLVEARRFHKVTAQKWAAAGARYVCWVCPEEKLLRPGARHGGFAFLFHELDEAAAFYEIFLKFLWETEVHYGSWLHIRYQ